MAVAAPAGFVAMVTTDKNMRHQQHEPALLMTVLVLVVPRNTLEEVAKCVPEVLVRLGSLGKPCFIDIHPPKEPLG